MPARIYPTATKAHVGLPFFSASIVSRDPALVFVGAGLDLNVAFHPILTRHSGLFDFRIRFHNMRLMQYLI